MTRKDCKGCPELSEVDKDFCMAYGEFIPPYPETFGCDYKSDEDEDQP